MNVILGILFLILSNVEVNFLELEISWRIYIYTKVILTIKPVELIGKKKFAIFALDLKK